MKDIFVSLQKTLGKGENAVLATVTYSSGATPRGAGARMLVGAEGRLAGTVGGGAVEYRSIQYSQEVLQEKQSRTHNFHLTKNDIEDIGMICGGDATVHFLHLDAGDSSLLKLVDVALEKIKNHSYAWLITDLSESDSLGLALYAPAEKNSDQAGDIFLGYPADHKVTQALLADVKQIYHRAEEIEAEDRSLFVEELVIPGFVYIFGGGHVGQALVPALAAVDFAPVVLDDREEFVNPDLFPEAFDVRLADLDDIAASVTVTDRDYVCVMTRGHTKDLEVQAQVLKTPARYIGVIGSKKKTKTINERLMDRGFTEEDLARITAPIGLNIGGKTPAEIAVSITAQLIQDRSADYKQGN
ncbi:MAG: XdhC/CoxI family protein [Eubacteriales bacterium]|nr:XdhC/CoxI family protein [Eubacteriales bacterium]MDD4540609.1 XdhC/CoxI family protein [Eubacteriales bacterium]